MSLLHPDPPFRHISQPQHVSTSEALSKISQYLQDSEKDEYVYLHPDCTFDARGPTRTAHATTRGLVLHQLWRIKEGLEGKNLGEEAILDEFDNRENEEEAEEFGEDVEQEFGDDYEPEQNEEHGSDGEEVGEIGDRNNVVGMVDEIPHIESSLGKKRKAGNERDRGQTNGEGSKKKKSKKDAMTASDDQAGSERAEEAVEPISAHEKSSSKSEETKEERKARRRAQKDAKAQKVGNAKDGNQGLEDSKSTSKGKKKKIKKEREKT